MHTFEYKGSVKYDKTNDITSLKVNTAIPWSHRGPLEHNLEHDEEAAVNNWHSPLMSRFLQ